MPMHKCSAASTLLLTRLLVQAGILGMPNGAFLYADQLNEVLTAKSEQGGFKDLVRGPCCPLTAVQLCSHPMCLCLRLHGHFGSDPKLQCITRQRTAQSVLRHGGP